MNHTIDPLARLRAERAAEHSAMAQQWQQNQTRCETARAFGYRLAVERLSWAEIKEQRGLINFAKYAPEYAHAHPLEPRTVGKGDMTMRVHSSPEWAAFLDGIDLAAQAVESQG